MISEERYGKILDILQETGNVSLQSLMQILDTSESTIRRDLKCLEDAGRLKRVHGGAVLRRDTALQEDKVSSRRQDHPVQKRKIGQLAAAQIQPGDVVYIDAGTTTEAMLPFVKEKEAVFVTNAISHAKTLSDLGCKVYIPGGQFRALTEAIVGEETSEYLDKYHFTKGFFGTNAVNQKGELSTPDLSEAMTKKKAMEHSQQVFVLCDTSKFLRQSSVTFGDIKGKTVITNKPFDEKRYEQASFLLV